MKAEEIDLLIKKFLSGRSTKTKELYYKDLNDFTRYLGVTGINNAVLALMSSPHSQANLIILHYKSLMQEAGLKSATINRRLSALRMLVKTAIQLELVPWKLEIQNDKIVITENTGSLGRENLQKMLKASKKQCDNQKGKRDYAILRLLHDMALKRSAIVNMDMEDLDLKNNRIYITLSADRSKKIKKIPAVTAKALKSWLNVRGTVPGAVFINFDHAKKGNRLSGTSIYRIVRQLGREVGIETGPNGLRHTAICHAIKKARQTDINIKKLISFSDHRNAKSLKYYQEINKEELAPQQQINSGNEKFV